MNSADDDYSAYEEPSPKAASAPAGIHSGSGGEELEEQRRKFPTAGSTRLGNNLSSSSSAKKDEEEDEAENDKDSSSSSSSTTTAAAAAGSSKSAAASGGIRPIRSVAANAVAISEAKSELVKKKKGRPRKVPTAVVQERNDKIASSINGLDFLHEITMKCIEGEFSCSIRLAVFFIQLDINSSSFSFFFLCVQSPTPMRRLPPAV